MTNNKEHVLLMNKKETDKHLTEIYKSLVGDKGINHYTPEELIEYIEMIQRTKSLFLLNLFCDLGIMIEGEDRTETKEWLENLRDKIGEFDVNGGEPEGYERPDCLPQCNEHNAICKRKSTKMERRKDPHLFRNKNVV